jgi:lysophospholipase L1-like esterase
VRTLPNLARLVVLAGASLSACSGTPEPSDDAGASGGSSGVTTTGGASGSAGANTGGTSSGGSTTGGTNAGGVSTGGASTGGATAGGAGANPGGASGTSGTAGGGGTAAGGTGGAGTAGSSGGGTTAGGSNAGGSAGSAGAGKGGTAGSAGAAGSVPLDPALLSRCTGSNPIVCSIPAPNGNHDVSVELGSDSQSGSSWIQAETRRYEVAETATASGSFSLHTFTVNVRQEQHDGGQSAPGGVLDLTIGGSAPRLHGLGVRAAPASPTIFVAGDSTACDWAPTNSSSLAADEAGWAQELALYLRAGVAVANYADSGETAGSFYTKFFPAARTAMKAGDYLFIQFGHNDQKAQADIDAYQANLRRYVTDARAKGATAVVVSPVSRSSASASNPGFAGLDQQARDFAASDGVALIDLTTLSRNYYASAPNRSALFIDGTHFHEVGAIGVAGVVAQALTSSSLPLASFLR